ncbi:MAG: iron-containing redox enzyme family protein [Deltaproteobacteria bacterium]|nr:iron-containing redox enzyme family protein [Deltaproteobacteria bacterium]MBW2210628.1 iron-containing redox enzyme family protein [Deltaproteobacteria bacterium]MBW2215206.1 iron-containing redox enzyme family protein [Deltaproteobacteria bacterium]MBW2550689.1 iron-containing redox enzyme family protein [Deltaproteobacteria bacterium]MBW2627285.1 iron-containing redox enzyme family protein [Deltaproteobacteria bacterium]
MDVAEFQEALLQQMERKTHWAWPAFTGGLVARDKLHIHLEHEWEVYVRDFPIMVGRAYVQCPIAEVRRELAENLYEEETGGLAAGKPHPDLFMMYPRGLGMDVERFANVQLLPAARAYRELLDDATTNRGWAVAAAISTLFIEGTAYERHELDPASPPRPQPALEEHPLAKHYGLPVECLALTKAHRTVEGEHRKAAWRVMLNHLPADDRVGVVRAMSQAVEAWCAYRDDVAEACGITRDALPLTA